MRNNHGAFLCQSIGQAVATKAKIGSSMGGGQTRNVGPLAGGRTNEDGISCFGVESWDNSFQDGSGSGLSQPKRPNSTGGTDNFERRQHGPCWVGKECAEDRDNPNLGTEYVSATSPIRLSHFAL